MSEGKHTNILQGTDYFEDNHKGVVFLLFKKKKKRREKMKLGFTIQKTFWSCHGNVQAQCFQYCCLQL